MTFGLEKNLKTIDVLGLEKTDFADEKKFLEDFSIFLPTRMTFENLKKIEKIDFLDVKKIEKMDF